MAEVRGDRPSSDNKPLRAERIALRFSHKLHELMRLAEANSLSSQLATFRKHEPTADHRVGVDTSGQ